MNLFHMGCPLLYFYPLSYLHDYVMGSIYWVTQGRVLRTTEGEEGFMPLIENHRDLWKCQTF